MPRPRRKRHQLQVWYGRERRGERHGILGDLTPRFGDASLRYVMMEVFNDNVLRELEERGFKLSTLRFSIDKTTDAIAEHERLAGRLA